VTQSQISAAPAAAIDWRPLQDILQQAERVVISSHVRPDGDALGSELGLAGILESLGKSVRIVNPSATPDQLAFLDPEQRIMKIRDQISAEQAREADLHLIVDTSAWAQLNELRSVLEQTPARKVVIDHHISSDDLGADCFKDTTAAATGILITELAEFLEIPLSKESAQALFCAVATDTGWFRFPNADVRTYRTAARLIEYGAEPSLLYRNLYERSTLARLKLQSLVLARVQLECAGRVAFTYVERKDFQQTGAQPTDTEDLVNQGLAVNGVEGAFILVEQIDGRIKGSLRSRTSLNVAAIAERFGGGGHRQAAGVMLPGPMNAARETLLKEFAKVLTPLDP
jgi:phosphoesterase RecJ-like protein